MDDWDKRYGVACKEANEAKMEWDLAEAALARANARRSAADRVLSALFRERAEQVNA